MRLGWNRRIIALIVGISMGVSFTTHLLGVSSPLWKLSLFVLLAAALFTVVSEKLILPSIQSLLHNWSYRTRIVWILVAGITGGFLAAVIPVTESIDIPWGIVLFVMDVITLGAVFLWVGLSSVARHARRVDSESVPAWSWMWYALPCAIVWLIWLLAFWPGIMSPDSMDQWGQMLTGQFNDGHPVFHTLTNWLITRVWLSPAVVAVTQIMVLSVLTGLALKRFRQLGTPQWAVWLTCGVFALLPANAVMMITLWKDIPYALSILALTLIILEFVVSEGAVARRPGYLLLLGGTAALVALFRHNGLPVAVGALVILLIAYHRYFWRLALAFILAVVIWWGVRGPLYQAVDASTGNIYWAFPMIHHIAAFLDAGTELTVEEKEILDKIHPTDGGWNYDCNGFASTIYAEDFNMNNVYAYASEFRDVYFDLVKRRPLIILDYMLCSGSYVWRITQPPEHFYYAANIGVIGDQVYGLNTDNPFGLAPQPVLAGLYLPLAKWVVRTASSDLSWLFWRSALFMYLGIMGAAFAALRSKNWKYLLIMSPVMLNSLVMFLLGLNAEFRYQYPVYIISLLFCGFLWLGAGTSSSMTGQSTNNKSLRSNHLEMDEIGES